VLAVAARIGPVTEQAPSPSTGPSCLSWPALSSDRFCLRWQALRGSEQQLPRASTAALAGGVAVGVAGRTSSRCHRQAGTPSSLNRPRVQAAPSPVPIRRSSAPRPETQPDPPHASRWGAKNSNQPEPAELWAADPFLPGAGLRRRNVVSSRRRCGGSTASGPWCRSAELDPMVQSRFTPAEKALLMRLGARASCLAGKAPGPCSPTVGPGPSAPASQLRSPGPQRFNLWRPLQASPAPTPVPLLLWLPRPSSDGPEPQRIAQTLEGAGRRLASSSRRGGQPDRGPGSEAKLLPSKSAAARTPGGSDRDRRAGVVRRRESSWKRRDGGSWPRQSLRRPCAAPTQGSPRNQWGQDSPCPGGWRTGFIGAGQAPRLKRAATDHHGPPVSLMATKVRARWLAGAGQQGVKQIRNAPITGPRRTG